MLMPFTRAMHDSIENQIERCHQNGSILDVYRAAETARLENAFDNVPLEDIIDQIVIEAGARCAVQFLPESLLAITNIKNKYGTREPLPYGKLG